MEMRKIISMEDDEKKKKRNNLIIGIILILVMSFSVIGYSFLSQEKNSEETTKIVYNDVEFIQNAGFWNTDVGNYRYSFKYNPKETSEIDKTFTMNSKLIPVNAYSNEPLYIYSNNVEAATEIYKNLFYQNRIALRVQDACLEGEKCEEDLPVKNCTDHLIIIKESNETSIKQQESCVFIEGKSENLTQLSDSFLFKIIGI